jgi:hypothetical protein
MRFSTITILSLVLVVLLSSINDVSGVDLFPHRQRSRTQTYLPRYNYDQSAWPYTSPNSYKGIAFGVAATVPNSIQPAIKPFHFRATGIQVRHLTLDQVGLAMYRWDGRHPDLTRQVVATGRITHDGGDGGLVGSNVTIRLRAYVSHVAAQASGVSDLQAITTGDFPLASPNEVSRLPPDAFMVWSSEQRVWIPRGGPHSLSLVPTGENFPNFGQLIHHFDEITHLEVEMEYRPDR